MKSLFILTDDIHILQTLDEEELLDDGLSSPTSRGRAESNQEYVIATC